MNFLTNANFYKIGEWSEKTIFSIKQNETYKGPCLKCLKFNYILNFELFLIRNTKNEMTFTNKWSHAYFVRAWKNARSFNLT